MTEQTYRNLFDKAGPSRALVEELTGQAEQALSGFERPEFLLYLARALAGRRS